MPKVKLLKDTKISHDGITSESYEEGETVEVSDENHQNLISEGSCAPAKSSKTPKTDEEKAAEAKAKEDKKAKAEEAKAKKAAKAKKKKAAK